MRAIEWIDALQTFLESLYDIGTGHRAADFLVTDRRVAQALDPAGTPSPERLLLRQGGDTLELSLYLDHSLLAQLPETPDRPVAAPQVNAFCTVLEGVSHFLYAVDRGERDRPFSRLELELQAEVDKYATLATLIRRTYGTLPESWLGAALFQRIRFDPALSPAELTRYRRANTHAARYCEALRRRYAWCWAGDAAREELRRFFRMEHIEKMRHIQRHC